jgi:guanosine-3',5'-bis(diphosphate) 3'-pyrophosphohydrolase
MSRKYTKTENEIIEKAILFLVNEYTKNGFNEKPVIFHSMRVACLLVENNAIAKTVVAALLHDLIEDSEVKLKLIESKFGSPVAKLVDAVSFKPDIKDKKCQYQEMFARTKKSGIEALMIKCADILDNSTYYNFGKNKFSEDIILDKLKYFLTLSKSKLKNYKLFIELKQRQKLLLAKYKREYKENKFKK